MTQPFNPVINIDGRSIGTGQPPYIIAEMSANHNGDIDNALAIIEMAKRAGAHAVKLQTYTADTLTIDCDLPQFTIQAGLWAGRTLHDLYQEAHLPWDWHAPLFNKAREEGITLFSSPFDTTAVDLLESLNAPAYKIASFEAIDHHLIEYTANTGKPVIISTGMADADEIAEAIEVVKFTGNTQCVLLHCVSGYPAPAQDYNLATITDMQQRFDVPVGLSDHTVTHTSAVAAVALGACMVEKHVTLDKRGGGPDDSFSLEERDLHQLCESTHAAWQALGQVNYQRKPSEQHNLVFRRSLYAVEDIEAGETLSSQNIRSIRPGYGLAPKHLTKVLGKQAKMAIRRGTALAWEHIDK